MTTAMKIGLIAIAVVSVVVAGVIYILGLSQN
jgi:hypothetical protein